MGQRGPEPLPEHLRRVHRVGVWLNEVELEDLERALAVPGLAKLVMYGGKDVRKGLKRASEAMRDRVFGRRVRMTVPEINRLAYADLGRLGNNVNQIAAAINAGMLSVADREALDGVLADLQEVRRALLGLAPPPTAESAPANDERTFKVEF